MPVSQTLYKIFTFNMRSLTINITVTPYSIVVSPQKYRFDRFLDRFLIQSPDSTLNYQYGITRKISAAPVDKLLRDLLQEQREDARVLAAASIGDLGFQQFEIDILDHVARHDVSLHVRAAAKLAINSITSRLMR